MINDSSLIPSQKESEGSATAIQARLDSSQIFSADQSFESLIDQVFNYLNQVNPSDSHTYSKTLRNFSQHEVIKAHTPLKIATSLYDKAVDEYDFKVVIGLLNSYNKVPFFRGSRFEVSLFHYAIKQNEEDLIKFILGNSLLKSIILNDPLDNEGLTPIDTALTIADPTQRASMVKDLSKIFNIDIKDTNGKTALLKAVDQASIDLVNLLLTAGANPHEKNTINFKEISTIHYAGKKVGQRSWKHEEIFKQLNFYASKTPQVSAIEKITEALQRLPIGEILQDPKKLIEIQNSDGKIVAKLKGAHSLEELPAIENTSHEVGLLGLEEGHLSGGAAEIDQII